MRKRFTYGLLAALMACGCQEEDLNLNIFEPTSFTASIEDLYSDGATKTSLDGGGNVLWKKGDQVSVFAGSTINEQYQITDDSDGKTSANLNRVSSPDFGEGSEIDNNVAYYPYSSTNAIAKDGTGYKLSVTLPSTQTYAEASFANGSFPMAAITSSADDMNLKLKNILGGLKLQLKGTASIASISISGNADEILCGAGDVSLSTTGVPSIALTDASAKTITLDCGTGVQLNTTTATPFIIALPPMTMASGFTVIVNDMEGKRMEIKTEKPQTITRSSLLKMSEKEYEGHDVDYTKEPFTITSNGSTSISIKKHESTLPNHRIVRPHSIVLQYKKNNGNWITYGIEDNIELSDGEKVQFKAGTEGNDNFGSPENFSTYAYYYISSEGTGSIDASGNIMSLLDRDLLKTSVPKYGFTCLFKNCKNLADASNLKLPATTLADWCYYEIFSGCTGLTKAPELPATALAEWCYYAMFLGCTSLTQAPELPVTTLAYGCYCDMFSGCTGLTKAPELPATKLTGFCYSGMFSGCTSLTQAPELPVTALVHYCYSSMFSGCTSLTHAPELPATTLASDCYSNMFSGCTGLTQTPELPVTTLAGDCYLGMFRGCTGLTQAPELPATALAHWCYYDMFEGCTGLTQAPELPATTLASTCYYEMFKGCTGLTKAPELPATTLASSCYCGMFRGCTGLTKAPELPATALAHWCYYDMFEGCTGLTQAPELPATALAERCYYEMFDGCISLAQAPKLPATALARSCYDGMFRGCTGLTQAPELPATTLANDCYSRMFEGCTSLDYVKALFIDKETSSDPTNRWLLGVSKTGTFVKNSNAKWTPSNIPEGWTIIEE